MLRGLWGHLNQVIDYRNAFRFGGQPHWFDFWNLRVVLPEEGKWFFIMPHILSGQSVGEADRFTLFSGVLGDEGAQSWQEKVKGEWTASSENALVQWEGGVLEEGAVVAKTAQAVWDVRWQRKLSDGTERGQEDKRAFDVVERLYLRKLPFVHRVPTMRGIAEGSIVQFGKVWDVEGGWVYQAKNHGTAFPNYWTWIHAVDTGHVEPRAMEVASMPTSNGSAGIFRWATPEGTRFFASFLGDEINLQEEDGHFSFTVKSSSGILIAEGEGEHGDIVDFSFPTPRGALFATPESFNGRLRGIVLGEEVKSDFPALGHAQKRTSISIG